jgi:hypothetical protein
VSLNSSTITPGYNFGNLQLDASGFVKPTDSVTNSSYIMYFNNTNTIYISFVGNSDGETTITFVNGVTETTLVDEDVISSSTPSVLLPAGLVYTSHTFTGAGSSFIYSEVLNNTKLTRAAGGNNEALNINQIKISS